ncbi:MAG: DMT family transporter [Bacillota bacterium]|nr:DMT family transporter [Bacillota bacterium]
MKKGYIAIMFAVIPWGISFLNTKVVIQVLGAMTLCFFRFLIAFIIIAIMAFLTKKDLRINKEDIKYFLLAGGVGITVYFYFENSGMRYIEPSAASLILASMPIATIFAEAIFDDRKLSEKMMFGGIVSLIGVGIIISGDIDLNNIFNNGVVKGYLMMLGAIASWIIYALSTKVLFEKYSQFAIVFYQFMFGVVLAFPFVFFENNSFELVNNVVLLNILALGVFSSAIGFFSYNYAMKVIGVSKASLFINFIPIVTIIASYFHYGSLIGVRQIVGGIFIVASVLINKENEEIECLNSHRNIGE